MRTILRAFLMSICFGFMGASPIGDDGDCIADLYAFNGAHAATYLYLILLSTIFVAVFVILARWRASIIPRRVHHLQLDVMSQTRLQLEVFCCQLLEPGDMTFFPSLETSHQISSAGASAWMACSFLLYIALRRGDGDEIISDLLVRFDDALKMLLEGQHEMVLTSAGIVMSVLHLYDQRDLVRTIALRAMNVAERVLLPSDPIRITFHFLALTADASGTELQETEFTAKDLKTAYLTLKTRHDPTHPSVISALMNYAWLLRWTGDVETAVKYVLKAREASERRFGFHHVQTIMCTSIHAGCLQLDEKYVHSAMMYRIVVQCASQIFGRTHPYTLEALRRFADCLYRCGHINTALQIDLSVLAGRTVSLGTHHAFTLGQRTECISRLRQYGEKTDIESKRWYEQQGVHVEEHWNATPEEAWMRVGRAVACCDQIEVIGHF